MQATQSKKHNLLLGLLILNVLISLAHYAHNIIFLPQYYEPSWITPSLIDASWFVMTPLGCIGYQLYGRGKKDLAYYFLYTYCFFSLFVLGHYIATPIETLSTTINIGIWAEAIAAIVLTLHTLGLQKSLVRSKSTLEDS